MQELEQIIRNVNAVREAVIEGEKNPNSEAPQIRALTASLALVESFLLDVRRTRSTLIVIEASDDMVEGYLDGFKDDRNDMPTSLSNRSASYRHGWANGRDDRRHRPRASTSVLRRELVDAIAKDACR